MKLQIFALILAANLLVSCKPSSNNESGKQKPAQDTSIQSKKNVSREYHIDLNDLARFYAGMKPEHDSTLINLSKDSIWIKHSQFLTAGFESIEKNRYTVIRKWRDEELKAANSSGIKTLYYPLSGPDFLNAFELFPNHENYIMVALEPSGIIKDLSKMKRPDLKTYLSNISSSLADIFKRSYFITRKMSGDFSRWKIEGNLPTMMVFLARTGNTIKGITRIAIDSNGNKLEFHITDSVPKKYISRGVQIDFVQGDETKERHLYYLSTNLGDIFYEGPGLDVNKGFIKWVQGFGEFNSYCKAASYVLHYGTFSLARNLVLNQSRFHLQDDSGIAYHYFSKKNWKFKYYGKYSHPIAEFGKIYEKDLAHDMLTDSANVKDIPFKLGYHWGQGTVNLLLAERR